MIDLTKAAEPKTDRLNADCLIGGRKIITITSVEVKAEDQPVVIHYEGEDKRPFRPCKSMIRVLVHAWGKDGAEYKGRQVELYTDPSVKWGGQDVGGIRISAMSHIKAAFSMPLTVTRGKKSIYSVAKIETETKNALSDEDLADFINGIDTAENMPELSAVAKQLKDGNFEDGANKKKVTAAYKEALTRVREAE